jgi:hypothetical protein
MSPVPIPFPLSTAPGARPQESAGRLINCYAEPLGPTERAPAIWRRVPGLSQFANTAFTGFRGGILVNNLFFAAFANVLVTIDVHGSVTFVGALSGTKRVFFARNNLTPTPQIACVTENGAFLVSTSSVVSWPDPNLPIPNSVCFQDGYFFFTIGDRRCFASGINASSVHSQCFITAEAKSSDSLVRAIAFNGLLFLCATSSIEVWNDTANPAPGFPYSRLAVIQRGLAGPYAIAGWEDGFGKGLIFVGEDNGVYRLDNLQPTKISPPDLDRLIEAVPDKATLEAGCYTHAGHSVWVLSSPNWTWEFNLNNEKWHERQSYGLTRWRATGSQFAFGKWLTGDTQTGKILFIDDAVNTEVGEPLRVRLESGPVAAFPNRVRIARADFDFITGVGIADGPDPIATDPTIAISWSNDDGISWGNPIHRKLGRQSDSQNRLCVLNAGLAGPQGRRWRLDISDPVYVGFLNGVQSTRAR